MTSAMHQHESAIGKHTSRFSGASYHLPPCPTPGFGFPGFGFPGLGFPGLGFPAHTSNSHWLSVLHMVTYIFQCYSLKSSYPLLPSECPKV